MSLEKFCARVALTLSLAAMTNQALAAPPAAVKEPGETAQYRALLEEAVSEYDARRYEEARALFRRAHDISPNARTLRGIGMASFELREYVEAMRSLEGSLADTRRPLTATQRQQVEALLERTRAFVGRFFLKLTPKQTILRIDGAPMTLESDGSLLLSFGRHSVAAEASGSVPESREVNVIGGERQELAFQLRASAAVVAPPIKPTGPGGEGGGGGTTDAPSTGAAWWYGAAGVAAAGTIGAAIWWRVLDHRYNQCASNAFDPKNPEINPKGCSNADEVASSRRLAAGTTIGAASAALVLAIIGTVAWASKRPEAGTAIACGLGPGAVNCELKFSF